ncbi:MAG: AAA family ATPase [Flavobacteriales bacterium]|nr:AAA family ATPase [Flavobacteriales bacterium]
MIKRSLAPIALERLRKRPAVAILGARQVGKTTLSMQLVKDLKLPHLRLDLQDPDDLALLVDAKPFLSAHANELVVIDEVQRKPELFPLLRSLIDKDRRTGRFLLLGSSSPAIVQAASESLAGRITYLDLYPFSLHEVGAKHLDRLWLRGGYPDAFLADTDADAFSVLMDILRSFTERPAGIGPTSRPGEYDPIVAHANCRTRQRVEHGLVGQINGAERTDDQDLSALFRASIHDLHLAQSPRECA